MEEDQYLVPGDHLTQAETRWGSLGLAICYDLRFPEIFRAYAIAGARMVLLPSEWPHPRLEHWRTLIRARAIENQMFVIACNRVGVSKETTFCGHSAIIDPWGETVIEGGESPTLLTAEIDVDRVEEVQKKIPVLRDRRPEIYRHKIKKN
jgi:predicted amidohydrolase